MISRISYFGYFSPALFSYTGQLLDKLATRKMVKANFCLKGKSCSKKLESVILRCIMAVCVIFAALADILYWSIKNLGDVVACVIRFSSNRPSADNYPPPILETLANLIACFAAITLSIAIPFGYLPQINVKRRFLKTFDERMILHRYRVAYQRQQENILPEEDLNAIVLRIRVQHQLSEVCYHLFPNPLEETHIKEVYDALILGADPNHSVYSLFQDPEYASNPSHHPLSILALNCRVEEVNRYIRIAEMLIYAGSRMHPKLYTLMAPGRNEVICRIYERIINEIKETHIYPIICIELRGSREMELQYSVELLHLVLSYCDTPIVPIPQSLLT